MRRIVLPSFPQARAVIGRAVFCLLMLPAGAARAEVVINEAAFDQPAGLPDWVELYNSGPGAVSVDGWTLSDMDVAAGKEVVVSLSTPVPAGAFLLVYVKAAGADDADFSDGKGAVYSGTATTVNLAATEDELLLRSPQGPGDFVAWVTDGHYDGAADQADAVAAGIWTAGAAAALADAGSGYSIARAADGEDADVPEDFVAASSPTPGAANAAPPSAPPPPGVPAAGDNAAPREVVINEIAWGGTAASSSHEWIELLNDSTRTLSMKGWRLSTLDGDVAVSLSGSLPAGGYDLLERTSDAPVGDASADQVYTGSLSNGGEDLFLFDASSSVVDAAHFSGGWPAGSGSPGYLSMERVTPSVDGDLAANWRSNDGVARNGLDAQGGPLNGTPKARNSAYSLLLPSSSGGSGGAGLPSGGRLSVDPASNPFSPGDSDPARRAARIFFDAGSPDAVKTIRICDVRGEVVRSFSDADGLAGTAAGEVLWDGTDQGGRLLPPGLYLVHLEAVEASGARRTGKDRVVLGYGR